MTYIKIYDSIINIKYIGVNYLQKLLKVFKALSDETRIRLLKLLQHRELCVCELMQVLNMTQSRISRNLGILKNAGLVKDRRDGSWVHYSINDDPSVSKILEVLKNSINDDEIIISDFEKLNRAKKLSKC